MIYTFNGSTKIVALGSGAELDVVDLYSRWKDWVAAGNAQYPQAFTVIGGEPIDATAGIYVTGYFFLANGWRIRPNEANYKLQVIGGVLLVDGGGDPFVATVGTYNVLVQYSQPIRSETVATGGGGGLTSEQDTMLRELYRLAGLESGTALVVGPTTRTAGAIEQSISEAAGVTTVERV